MIVWVIIHNVSMLLQSGERLLTGCNDKCVRIFDVRSRLSESEVTIEAHKSAIKCSVWSKDPNCLITCGEDLELR